MKKLLIIPFLFAVAYGQITTTAIVADTTKLKAYNGSSAIVYVSDSAYRGYYISCPSCTANSVSVFTGTNSRKWQRSNTPEISTKPTLATLTQLRTGLISSTMNYQTPDGGIWSVDASDASSTDNTGTILVNGSTRIKRLFDGNVYASWFGVTSLLTLTTPSGSIQSANRIALQKAINYCLLVGGKSVILPQGFTHVDSTIEINATLQTPTGGNYSYQSSWIGLSGAGSAVLVNNHATAPLIRVVGATVRAQLTDIKLWGRGSTTTGDLLELVNTQYWKLQNVEFRGTGGRGVHFIGSSERGYANNARFIWCRQAATTASAAINECYFFDTHALGCGYTVDPLNETSNKASYSVNVAGNGYSIKTSGNYLSERHAAFYFQNATNVRMIGGSIKSTDHLGGIKVIGVANFQIDNFYFEGFNASGANPSVIAYGQSDSTSLTQDIGTGDLTFTVADTKWFHNTEYDTTYESSYQSEYFVIYDPADINTYEVVTLKAFWNGKARLAARAQASTTAHSWSSGAIIRQYFGNAGNNNNVVLVLNNNHLSSYQGLPGTTTLVRNTLGATAGEVVNGIVYDQFHTSSARVQGSVRTTSSNNVFSSYALTNGGKVQMHQSSEWFDLRGDSRSNMIGSQDVATDAQYAAWNYLAPNETYVSNTSNNLPAGMKIERGASEGINLGGYGLTNRVIGQRGLALTKESIKDSVVAAFDDKGSVIGWKVYKKASGVWTANVQLTSEDIRLGAAKLMFGTGSPEGVSTAPVGSMYLRTDGGAGTTLYIKESGTGNTGWVAK